MTRSRTLRPGFFSSFTLAKLPRDVRLFFAGLWVEADDDGRLIDSPKQLAGAIFPHDEDVGGDTVTKWIDALEEVGVVRRYEASNGHYLHVSGFAEHQKPPHPTPSRLPPPPHANGVSPSRQKREKGVSASRRRREPVTDVSRTDRESRAPGFKGLGLRISSSSGFRETLTPSSRAPDEDDEEDHRPKILEAALDVLVERRLAATPSKITNPTAWRRATRAGLAVEVAERVAGLDLAELADPEALADYLDPARPAAAPPPRQPRYGTERTCPTCEGNRWIPAEVGDGVVRCPDCNPEATPS